MLTGRQALSMLEARRLSRVRGQGSPPAAPGGGLGLTALHLTVAKALGPVRWGSIHPASPGLEELNPLSTPPMVF